jgi:hypothetical protein
MASNNISSDGAIKIAHTLEFLQHLQILQLQDNAICGSADSLGQAMAQLRYLRYTDLSDNPLGLADCCKLFDFMISSKAPTATLMLPSKLHSEIPALFSCNPTHVMCQTIDCWCGGCFISLTDETHLYLQVGIILHPNEASPAPASQYS